MNFKISSITESFVFKKKTDNSTVFITVKTNSLEIIMSKICFCFVVRKYNVIKCHFGN